VLSGIDHTGAWQLAPETTVTAIIGSCKLDLRYATISSDVTTLDARILLGNLELIVPEGVDVEFDAAMIVSSRSVKLSRSSKNSSLKPLIRISGTVVVGSITVRDTPKLGERLREVVAGLLDPPRSDNRR
jgi:predicted membrane protein